MAVDGPFFQDPITNGWIFSLNRKRIVSSFLPASYSGGQQTPEQIARWLHDQVGVVAEMTIPEWVKEASIPVVSAIVGYGTNVVALQMTFYPVDFFGIKIWQPEDQPLGFCGWQGIVPAKAGKMAAKSVDLMTEQLIDVKDVFSRLDPWEMSEALKPGMRKPKSLVLCGAARSAVRRPITTATSRVNRLPIKATSTTSTPIIYIYIYIERYNPI